MLQRQSLTSRLPYKVLLCSEAVYLIWIPGPVQYSEADPNDIYLYRVNNEFKQEWAYKFPMLYREQMEDMEVLADSSIVLAGKTNSYSLVFTEQALVVKTSQNGMLNNCTNEPFNIVASDAPLNVIPVTIGNGALYYTYRGYPSIPVFDGSGFTWQLLCTSESICRLGKYRVPKQFVLAVQRYTL